MVDENKPHTRRVRQIKEHLAHLKEQQLASHKLIDGHLQKVSDIYAEANKEIAQTPTTTEAAK